MKIRPDYCLKSWNLSSHTLQRHSLMLGITIHAITFLGRSLDLQLYLRLHRHQEMWAWFLQVGWQLLAGSFIPWELMRRIHNELQEKHSQMKSRQTVKLKNRMRFTMYQFPGPGNFHTQLKRIVMTQFCHCVREKYFQINMEPGLYRALELKKIFCAHCHPIGKIENVKSNSDKRYYIVFSKETQILKLGWVQWL